MPLLVVDARHRVTWANEAARAAPAADVTAAAGSAIGAASTASSDASTAATAGSDDGPLGAQRRLVEAPAALVADLARWLGPPPWPGLVSGTSTTFDVVYPAGEAGGLRAIRVHTRPLPEPQQGWMLTLLDIEGRAAAPSPLAGTEAPTAPGAAAESHLALAVDLAGIIVWRHDLATRRLHLNAQGHAALGVAPRTSGIDVAEMRGHFHPDDLPSVKAAARAAMDSRQPIDLDVRYRRPDGSLGQMLTRRVALRDPAGRPVALLGVSIDQTERLLHRQREQELSRRFELVTRTAGIGYWSLDRASAAGHWSEPMRALLGVPAGEPVPSPQRWFERHAHPADRAGAMRSFQRWIRSASPVLELSFRILRPDGQTRQVVSHSRRETSGSTESIFGIVIDVTQQRSAEQALRGAQEQAALAARGAGLGTWQLDLRSGRTSWDEQMWALRGRPPRANAMTHDERLACVHPDDRERTAQTLDAALADGSVLHHEFRVVWPDGRVRWLASRSAEVHDTTDGSLRRIGVNWDITDSRTAATARQESEIARRESEAKSRFMARMSHELRTPLNAMLGFTALLRANESGLDAASRRRLQQLDHVANAGAHLLALIDDVLDLASLQGGEMRIDLTTVDVAPLVESTLPLLNPLLGQHQVRLSTGPLAHRVRADPKRLRQALLNLLTNAVKYNRPDGSVNVGARREGAQVVLRVTDTGHGMDEEQLRHLFEPFNRLGRDLDTVAGTGIGLAISRSLVERMGGSIAVRSAPGRGSTFELRLPSADAADPRGSSTPAPTQEHGRAPPTLAGTAAALAAEVAIDRPSPADALPSTRSAVQHQVLYIEDNPVNALIIRELLSRRSDITLHVAATGLEGVAMAHATRPDLVLLDMQLPDIDGFEVLRRLRADRATAGIACAALSANAMQADVNRAVEAGMTAYWTKPLDFKQFLGWIDGLFGPAPARPAAG